MGIDRRTGERCRTITDLPAAVPDPKFLPASCLEHADKVIAAGCGGVIQVDDCGDGD